MPSSSRAAAAAAAAKAPLVPILLLLAVLQAGRTLAADLITPSKDNTGPQCDCYLISGLDAGYFKYHRFWDFRDAQELSQDFTTAPALVTERPASGGDDGDGVTYTSSLVNSSAWLADWEVSEYDARGANPVPNIYSRRNVFYARNGTDPDATDSTYLTLRASRADSFMSSAQLASKQSNMLYASLRTRMRVLPNQLSAESAPYAGRRGDGTVDAGAVVGFFTYESDTQETDIEILTYDPVDQIHYSNQPAYDAATDSSIDGATTQMAMPAGAVWTEWNDHRIDWFPGMIRWWVNGVLTLEKKKNAPTNPSALLVNVWGDGGNWSGNMTVGGQVMVGFQHIEMLFNTSGEIPSNKEKRDLESRESKEKDMCEVGCMVDGVLAVGFPEQVYNSSDSAATGKFAAGQGVGLVYSLIFVAGLFFLAL